MRVVEIIPPYRKDLKPFSALQVAIGFRSLVESSTRREWQKK
jgi:hypothetical protein